MLLAQKPDSDEWSKLRRRPVCPMVEPRYFDLLNLYTPTEGGLFVKDGLKLGQIVTGQVSGLEKWGGPEILDKHPFIIKNPESSKTVYSDFELGEKNGLFLYGGFSFAAVVGENGLEVARPIIGDAQTIINDSFDEALAKVNPHQIPGFVPPPSFIFARRFKSPRSRILNTSSERVLAYQ